MKLISADHISKDYQVGEVAVQLRVARSVAYELVASGRLPSFRPSPGRVRVARSMLERWVVEESGAKAGK